MAGDGGAPDRGMTSDSAWSSQHLADITDSSGCRAKVDNIEVSEGKAPRCRALRMGADAYVLRVL